MPKCRTCDGGYSEGGDGYDGECPSCADKSYEDELKEGLTDLGKLAVDHGMDVHEADFDNDNETMPDTLAYLQTVEGNLNEAEAALYQEWKAKCQTAPRP